MDKYILAIVLILAGCDSPSLAFQDVPARSVTIEDSTFSVRVKDDRAEAMRVSREWLPRESVVMQRASRAIANVSGCDIKKMDGDQAIIRARLNCPDG